MPRYRISDPSGRTLVIEGQAPPNEAELEQLFAVKQPTASEPPPELREPSFWEKLRVSKPVEALLGPSEAEAKGMAEVAPRFGLAKLPVDVLLGREQQPPAAELPQTSAGGTFLREAIQGAAPSVAAAKGFQVGMRAPIPNPILRTGVGLVTSAIAGGTAALAQRRALEGVAPETAAELQAATIAGQEQHPIAAGAGRIAGAVPGFTVQPQALVSTIAGPNRVAAAKVLAKQVGMQEALTAGQTLVTEGRLPTKPELIESGVAGAVLGTDRFSKAKHAIPIRETETLPLGETSRRGEEVDKGTREQTPAQEKAPEPVLAPEDQTVLDEAAKVVGRKVAWQNLGGLRLGTIDRASGNIVLDPAAIAEELKRRKSPKSRAEFLEDLVAHEDIHLNVSEEDALSFWKTLTGLEQRLGIRVYAGRGKWKLSQLPSELLGPANAPEAKIAQDILRLRLQQAMGMRGTEYLDTVLRERMTVQALDGLSRVIMKLREIRDTPGGRRGLEILRQAQANIALARQKIAGSPAPAEPPQPETKEAKAETPEEEYARLEREGMGGTEVAHTAATAEEPFAITKPQRVTIEREDGTRYEAEMNGYYDLRSMGRGVVPSIGRKLENGQISHGLLKSSERIVSPVSIEEPAATRKRADKETGDLFDRGDVMVKSWAAHARAIIDDPAKFAEWKKTQDQKDYRWVAEGGQEPYAISKQARESAEKNIEELRKEAKAYRQSGDEQSAGELEEMAKWMEQKIGEESFPAAISKRKREELQTPPLGLEMAKPGEAVERTVDTGYRPPTAVQIAEKTGEYLSGTARPSFDDFAESMRETAPGIKPAELRDVWRDAVWKHLQESTGSELETLRNQLGLSRQLGTGTIPDARPPLTPAEAKAEAKARKARKVGGPGEEYLAPEQRAESHRNEVIATIGQRLVEEAEAGKRAWRRPSITAEEVATQKGGEAFRDIAPYERRDPEKLARTLTEGGAVERTTYSRKVRGGQLVEVHRKAPPESVTRRLTALLERRTGRVYLVSTYRHGRAGAMIVDPAATGARPNVPLKSIMQRKYDPIASILLDEPVQNFKQRFESVQDFNDQIGSPSREVIRKQESYTAPEKEGATFKTETGAHIAVPGVFQEGRGVFESRAPMTAPEALSIMDHAYSEIGILESPEDVMLVMEGLREDSPPIVMSAYRKLAESIAAKHENETAQQILERVAKAIYEHHTNAQSSEDFQQRIMAEAGSPAVEAAPAESPATSETSRELSKLARKSPAVGTERIYPIPTEIARAEKLSPEDIAKMSEDLERKYAPENPEQATDTTFEELSGRKAAPVRIVEYKGGAIIFYPKEGSWRTIGREMGSPYKEPTPAELQLELRALEDAGGDPASWSKLKQGAREAAENAALEFEKAGAAIAHMMTTKDVSAELTRKLDAVENKANNLGREVEKPIRMASLSPADIAEAQRLIASKNPVNKAKGWQMINEGNREVLAAARAVVTAGFDPQRLTQFEQWVNKGISDATAKAASPNWRTRREGRAQLQEAQNLQSEIAYARAHWGEANLQNTAREAKRILDERFRAEVIAGKNLTLISNYIPDRFDAEFFNGDAIVFGPTRILGLRYRAPRVFKNGGVYEAIAAGPYISVSHDVATLVGHRTRQGARSINRSQWRESWKGFTDPASMKPVALDPIADPKQPSGWKAPSVEYTLFFPPGGGKPIAILGSEHSSYGNLYRTLTAPSAVNDFVPAALALEWGQKLKHTLLMGDFFHLGRLTYYGAAIMGKKWGYRGGLTALEYGNPKDLAKAVSLGVITPRQAAWANGQVKVNLRGKTVTATRMGLKKMLVGEGLNVGRIADGLYADLAKEIPLIGGAAHQYQRWLFDRFTRGLMMQTALTEMERIQSSNPGMDARKIARQVARDTNVFYGSLGRQGVFRSQTFQDLSRLVFLAPQWVEGLARKEATAYSRAITKPMATLRGQETTARGIGRGLVMMFALTQAINLITKRQFTWQNEEPDHKLDAWIYDPSGGVGAWLSPLSVFNELTWEMVDGMEKKPKAWDALTQIGRNKLGLWGRAANVLWTSRSGMGHEITSSGGVVGEAVKQVAPVPLSFGRFGQEALSRVAPSVVPKPAPGATLRQTMGVLGFKTSVAQTKSGEIQTLARRFMEENKLKPETGWMQIQTDEPSYTKLRGALRNDDFASAAKVLEGLRKTRTDAQIKKAMKLYSRRPFTNSKENEDLFLYSLSPAQLEAYYQARTERQAETDKFLDWYATIPPKD